MRGRTNINSNISKTSPISLVLANKRYVNSGNVSDHAMIHFYCEHYKTITITNIEHLYNDSPCDVYFRGYTKEEFEDDNDIFFVSGGFRYNAYAGLEIDISKFYIARLELRGAYKSTTQIHFTLS